MPASKRSIHLDVPRDYVLRRDATSYGYFLLEPNRWVPENEAFDRTLTIDQRAIDVRITQPRPGGRIVAGTPLVLSSDRARTKAEWTKVRSALIRMLRLDEGAKVLAEFHRLDPRFKREGCGRLMRSPTFFEDLIKTVTSCNVTWATTIAMNRKLCQHFGPGSASGARGFPSPEVLSRVRPATLRARCSVGYRDHRIVELARMFTRGDINPEWFEDPAHSDQAVYDAAIALPGIGPYAASNLLQLLGRYARLPLDSEGLRHGETVLGFRGTDAAIMKRLKQHYQPMGPHAFRSYWFELRTSYQERSGPSWTWLPKRPAPVLSRAHKAAFSAEKPTGTRTNARG
jgi:3-methyladenine DNA glycosylase/8-oxoguanine DNA glycosylase